VRHQLALLLSELVSNAALHGGAGLAHSIQVRLASSRDRVRVEVFDPGRDGAELRDALRREGGGYGLLLVDHLADGWGREATDDGGSLAWFELDLTGLGDS